MQENLKATYSPIRMRVLIGLLCIASVWGYPQFQNEIPNGDSVPHPCKANYVWRGVGHLNPLGGGDRNPFGLDFKAAGTTWTKELCQKDSDGDGKSNGQELGDPNCVWTKGGVPEVILDLSHPGVCTPNSDPACQVANTWLECEVVGLQCDAISEDGMRNVTVRFPETAVPPTETNYFCMMFNLPTDGDYHMVATAPYIDNENVMHHILMYGCDETDGPITDYPLDTPMSCGMATHRKCSTLIGMWAVGFGGECVHKDVGFRIGANGFKKATFQIHWNNPQLRDDYMDSSGMILYYTANRRMYDANIIMVGQEYLAIPPGEEAATAEGWCEGDCTARLMSGSVYITRVVNHMHYLGRQQRTGHYRNGTKIRDLAVDESYSYDSPVLHEFQDPIEFRPGDAIKTTCTFKSVGKDKTTFKGDGTSEEMCYVFLTFHPSENIEAPICVSWKGIPLCKLHTYSDEYPVIDGCNVHIFHNSSHPDNEESYLNIMARCTPFMPCRKECKEYVRDVLSKNGCLNGDLGDYYRQFADYSFEGMRFWAAIDSCKAELEMESCQCPATATTGDCIGGVPNMAASLLVTLASLLISRTISSSSF